MRPQLIHQLNLDLGERSYPIFIGYNLLKDPQYLTTYIAGDEVLVVTNTTLAGLYLNQTLASLSGKKVDRLILPDGEEYKRLDQVDVILTKLLELNYSRKATLIALGGGVIGDTVGFAAAIYQRGINFIQIPTTLLAQVDSSVGGKTGVNHPLGKNMIGAFHQPKAVIIDLKTLESLPTRELKAGLAEVYKYGLILDKTFFDWCEQEYQNLIHKETHALAQAIYRSCQIKARVVAEDEKEAGKRALLNLGHTFGHAIEGFMGYGRWLHGEAIAVGMLMAAELSEHMGWIDQEAVNRIRRLLANTQLPTQPPAEMNEDTFMAWMMRDKKVMSGQLRLVLLKAIGQAIVTADYDPQALKNILTSQDD